MIRRLPHAGGRRGVDRLRRDRRRLRLDLERARVFGDLRDRVMSMADLVAFHADNDALLRDLRAIGIDANDFSLQVPAPNPAYFLSSHAVARHRLVRAQYALVDLPWIETAWRSGQPVVTTEFGDRFVGEGVRCIAEIPLPGGGSLGVNSLHQDAFPAECIERLRIFANVVDVVVRKHLATERRDLDVAAERVHRSALEADSDKGIATLVATMARQFRMLEVEMESIELRICDDAGCCRRGWVARAEQLPVQVDASRPIADALRECWQKRTTREWPEADGPGQTERTHLSVGRSFGTLRLVLPTEIGTHDRLAQLLERFADSAWLACRRVADVERRRSAEHELAQRAQQLAESNEDLERYAYMVSHDLKEPLRSVSAYSQLIVRRFSDSLPGEAAELLDFVIDGATRMEQLIEDLLAYARLESERPTQESTPVGQVLAQVLSELRSTIDESGAHVQAGELPTVTADPARLRQLLHNLVGNALKYASPERGPVVEVTAEEGEAEWRFRVRDNGIGIDEQDLDRIFTVFQRLHTRDDYGGTGIGLAICRRIAEQHGGRIWAEANDGPGTSFCFTLRKRPETDDVE